MKSALRIPCSRQNLQEVRDFVRGYLADLNGFTHGFPIHDDQTLLVIKFKSAQPPSLA